MLVQVFALAGPVGVYLVYPNFLVPAGYRQDLGSRREGEVGDGVLGRIANRDIIFQVADGVARRIIRSSAEYARHIDDLWTWYLSIDVDAQCDVL